MMFSLFLLHIGLSFPLLLKTVFADRPRRIFTSGEYAINTIYPCHGLKDLCKPRIDPAGMWN
jgi:hypothetical protein